MNPTPAQLEAAGLVAITEVNGYPLRSYNSATQKFPPETAYISAKWNAPPVVDYTVTFNAEGGTAVASETVVAGASIAAPVAPTRAGYNFNGWSDEPNDNSVLAFPLVVNENVTLYAQWTPVVVPSGLVLGINDHDLMWAAPTAYPIAQLKALGAKVHRCDLGAEAQFNTAFGYNDCLGTSGCAGVVSGWASQLRAISCQPMIAISFTSLPTANPFVADLVSLVKAVPGLWIEIGNELDYFGSAISIPEYVTLFAAVVSAVHEADPTCKIGPSPVSSCGPNDGGPTWLQAAFAAGLASIPYDFLPFHNYPYPKALSPTAPSYGPDSTETKIPWFTAQCKTWGNKAPCWMTEFGWQSIDTSATPNMTPALQASYLTEFIQSSEVQALPVAIIYELGGDGGGQYWGLIDSSGNEKPAFTAVQALA